MSTMYTLAVTVASNKGTVILQDNFPAEGPFILTVLPGTTGTVVISDNQFGRIQADLTALVAALACTYTITMTPSDPLFTALSTAITPGGSLTSPLQYKGAIAVNTSFPLVAVVASGWMYHVTADVTDNAGATYTNTGVAFLAGDEIVWDGAAWIKTGSTLTNPYQFKGSITAANTFPPPAATATTGVKDGWTYRVTTACTDNGGAAYTNTGQAFVIGDIIVWRTNAWYKIGSLVNDAAVAYEFGDYQIRTGAGAADLVTAVTQVVTAGVGTAITLAAGTVVGQNKIVRLATVTTPKDTAVLTITSGPGGPYTLRNAGDFIHVKWNGSTWGLVNQCPEVNTLVDRGAITTNTDFPPPTGNLRGDCYRVLADVIDNGGASYTNTGKVCTEGDHIMWDGVSAWVTLGKSYIMVEKGVISQPSHFPLSAFVKRGYVYRVTASTSDTAGASYTNTGLTFKEGDVIVWNGSTWTVLGNKVDFQVTAISPVVLAANDSINYVDTATLGAPCAVALPAATAVMAGRKITIGDGSGDCVAHNITITPNTTDRIDGVNAPWVISEDYGVVTFQCMYAGYWKVLYTNRIAVAGTNPGLMSAAMATTVAAFTDDHISVTSPALNFIVDETEVSAALNGDVAKHFAPTHVIVKVATVTGTPTTPGTLNVGTTTGGAEILSAAALTGLILVGDTRVIPITAQTNHLHGNGTVYFNVESAEAVATVMTVTVTVVGRQV